VTTGPLGPGPYQASGVVLYGQQGWALSGFPTPNNSTTDYSIQLAGGAFTPTKSGDGIGILLHTTVQGTPRPIAEGVANNWNAGGADYAEYFEWSDGNPNKQDRIGLFVALDPNAPGKIMTAQATANVVGIVSGTCGYAGDSAELHWHASNSKDEFGRVVVKQSYKPKIYDIVRKHAANKAAYTQAVAQIDKLHEDTGFKAKVKQIVNDPSAVGAIDAAPATSVTTANPALVDTKQYVPRSKRPEWSAIGLVGKIVVRDDGTLKPGGKCDCLNGMATAGSTWTVLKRTGPKTVQVLYFMK